ADLARVRIVQPAADQGIEPVHHAASRVGDQPDLLGVARLKTRRSAAGKVEPHAVGLRAVEDQRLVHLEEVIMGTDLHRPVAGVVDGERDDGSPRVELEIRLVKQVLARNHVLPPRNCGVKSRRAGTQWIGSWIVTSLLPSRKVGSTWIIGIISGTPSMT